MHTPLTHFARQIRRHAVQMVSRAGASHIGGALSMADILAALYEPTCGRLRVDPTQPAWPERDRFILSKGHACVGLYAALAEAGFIARTELASYAQDGSRLMSHVSHKVPGVEFSTGSLGHGLSFGAGLALGAKRQQRSWRTVVLLSDGELNEGSNWEAILFAGHHRLDNLWVVVDFNKIQSLGRVAEVLQLDPLPEKWQAFGWATVRVAGNDVTAVHRALTLDTPPEPGKPTVIIADTIKGAGIDFMEDQLLWHYKSPSAAQLESALQQLEVA